MFWEQNKEEQAYKLLEKGRLLREFIGGAYWGPATRGMERGILKQEMPVA
jgi:hypothetical protein